jgi:hypothetical protein
LPKARTLPPSTVNDATDLSVSSVTVCTDQRSFPFVNFTSSLASGIVCVRLPDESNQFPAVPKMPLPTASFGPCQVKVSALTTMPVIATTPQSADAAILLFLLAIIAIFSFLVQKMGSNIPKAAAIRNR